MITRVTSITRLKQLFIELFLNKTDRVSDVSDNSVLSATGFGVAKVAQKALKDMAISEAKIFPRSASGTDLDESAALFGVQRRRGATGSSTYIRLVANPGTVYTEGIHEFVANNGLRFELEEDFTMPIFGNEQGDSTTPAFAYVKIRCTETGERTNIEAEGIRSINPIPIGHIAATNEYAATGGADQESDEVYRQRIINNGNLFSVGTLEYFTQIFQTLDVRVLRLLNLGTNDAGKRELAVITQNGVNLTPSERNTLLEDSKRFFPITDLNRFGDLLGIELVNVVWHTVGGSDPVTGGIQFRIEFDDNVNTVEVRRNIQVNLNKYLDFRFWGSDQRVEWERLHEIVRNTNGVRYVPDQTFSPNADEIVPVNQLPRIAGFRMLDLNGDEIYTTENALSPVFYPAESNR